MLNRNFPDFLMNVLLRYVLQSCKIKGKKKLLSCLGTNPRSPGPVTFKAKGIYYKVQRMVAIGRSRGKDIVSYNHSTHLVGSDRCLADTK